MHGLNKDLGINLTLGRGFCIDCALLFIGAVIRLISMFSQSARRLVLSTHAGIRTVPYISGYTILLS